MEEKAILRKLPRQNATTREGEKRREGEYVRIEKGERASPHH